MPLPYRGPRQAWSYGRKVSDLVFMAKLFFHALILQWYVMRRGKLKYSERHKISPLEKIIK